MNSSTHVVRSDRAVFRQLAGEAGGVVLHLDSAAYYGVNATGALIWELLGDRITTADLFEQLDEALEEAPEDWRTDVQNFLHELHARSLVEFESAEG